MRESFSMGSYFMISIKIERASDNQHLGHAYGGKMQDAMRNAINRVKFIGEPLKTYNLRDCLGGLRAEITLGESNAHRMTIKRH
jgi:hypothetical protein